MRQTLFYIPPEIFGIPLFGYGLLLALIVLATFIAVVLRVRKHGMDADAWGIFPLGIVAGAIVVFVVPLIATPQGFPVRGYGMLLLIAISSAVALLMYRGKKLWNIPPDTIVSLSIWCVVLGILGARIFYIVEYWPIIQKETFAATLLSMVNISEGGLVVYGSIIGGTIGALLFLLWNRLPILATLDLLAPAVLLGISIGRIGCLMNGCCFGGACELPWAIHFPVGSNAHYHQIQHNDVFVGGLKFAEISSPTPEKSWDELVGLDPLQFEESLTHYAKDKRSRLQIEEVQKGSPAEKLGLRKGMVVLAFGLEITLPVENADSKKTTQKTVPTSTTQFFLVKDQLDWFRFVKTLIDYRSSQMIIAANAPEPYHLYTVPLEPWEVLWVHPTQIYSSILAALGCCLLLYLSRFCKKDGMVFLLFLIYYPLARFALEMIRTDEDSFLGTGLTVSQNVSLLLLGVACLFGVYLFNFRSNRRAYQGLFPLK